MIPNDQLTRLVKEIEQETRKKEEMFQLISFANSFVEFPSGLCSFSDKPDFCVEFDGKKLGIEHKRILISGEIRAEEKAQDRVLRRAQELNEERGGPMLWLTAHFSIWHKFRTKSKMEQDVIAIRLVEAVIKIDLLEQQKDSPSRRFSVEGWRFNFQYAEDFPEEIDTIHLGYVNKPGQVYWGAARSTFVPHLTIEKVQEEIESKNKKVESYQTGYGQLWLLLVVDGGDTSSIFDLPHEVANHRYQSSFDRVLYFDVFSKSVTKLALQ